jgi:mRNA interferase MazF
MKRGEIWWADASEPRGSVPEARRPVLIIQDDLVTASRVPTVTVLPLTTNLARALAAGNVRVSAAETGLGRESVILVNQALTLGREFLDARVGTLPRRALQAVDAGLRLTLDLAVP